MNLWRNVMVACVLAAAPGGVTVSGQNAGCALSVSPTSLEVGEIAEASIVCRNTDVPGLPQLAAPNGLSVQALGSTPSQSSMTQIVNGRRYSERTYTYRLRVIAEQAGKYTLGPFRILAGGSTYATEPVSITVRQATVDPTPRGDRIAFVQLHVEPRTVYVTQNITAVLTLGIRQVEIGGRTFEFDLLRDVLDQRSSQFGVFGDPADRTIQSSQQVIVDTTGAAHRYEIFRITKQIRAEEVGDLVIGPVFVRINYPTQLRRSFWGGFEPTAAEGHSARAGTMTVTVKSPPEEGRPASFTGAIGRYVFDVAARPTEVQKGEPITIAARIRGAPLDGVAGPSFSVQAELGGRFDFSADEPIGETEGGARVFRKAVFPKQIGEQTLPRLEWTYFDPSAERYVTLASEPIPIVVNPPSAPTTVVPMAGLVPGAEPDQSTRLTLLSGGLSPNIVDPHALLANQAITLKPLSVVAIAGPPVAWLFVLFLVQHRNRLASDPQYARRRRARREALARIELAGRNGRSSDRWSLLASAVTGYVAARFGCPGASLTSAEVRETLATNGVDHETSEAIVRFLESCDAARYTPSGSSGDGVSDAGGQVRRWIDHLEKHVPS